MLSITVFHSGNPAWMTCKKAIGVANTMKEKYGKQIDLNIYTTDSDEAQKYNFRSSTNVLIDGELIPVDIATDQTKLDTLITENLQR